MSEEEIKEIIDIVASIQVSNETEAIAKEELMSYAEQLQKEYNILTLLCDIIKLQHQLEEKDKIISEATNFINMIKDETYQSSVEGICDTALEILERGKNGK